MVLIGTSHCQDSFINFDINEVVLTEISTNYYEN